MLDQVERELILQASAEEVWTIVTSSGWLADEVRLELFPGGEANFSSEDGCKRGWVEEAVAPSGDDWTPGRLTFWWGEDEQPASRVELTLEPEGEQNTRLRVIETRPLEVLDVVGIRLPHGGGARQGPAMLVAA